MKTFQGSIMIGISVVCDINTDLILQVIYTLNMQNFNLWNEKHKKDCFNTEAGIFYLGDIIKVVSCNHLKKFIWVKSDNKLCNLIAKLNASFTHILNVKLCDAFFHHYTFNLVKIYRNIVDTKIILLVDSQKLPITNMVLQILL